MQAKVIILFRNALSEYHVLNYIYMLSLQIRIVDLNTYHKFRIAIISPNCQ